MSRQRAALLLAVLLCVALAGCTHGAENAVEPDEQLDLAGVDWRTWGLVNAMGTITRDGTDTDVCVCIHDEDTTFYYDEPEQIYYDSVQYPQTIQAARMAFAGIWFEDRNGDGSTDIRMAFDRNGEADNEVTLVWYWQAEDGYVFQPEESTPME